MRPSTLSSVAALAAHAMAAPQLIPVGHLSSIMATATSAFVDPKAELSTSTLFGPAPTEDIVTMFFHNGTLVTTKIYTETEAAVAKRTPRDVAPSVITPAPTLPIVLGQKFARSVKTASTNTPVIAGWIPDIFLPKPSKIPVAPDMAIVPGTTPRAFHCKVGGCFWDDDGSRVAKKARDVNERIPASTQTVIVVPTDAAPEDDDEERADVVLKARMVTRTRTVLVTPEATAAPASTAVEENPAFSSILSSFNAAFTLPGLPFEGHPLQ